jgi:sortase A
VPRRRRLADELSVDELRQLLIEKRRTQRQKRIDYYRRTGRVILVESSGSHAAIDTLQAMPLDAGPLLEEDYAPRRPSRVRMVLDRLLVLIEIAAVLGLGYIILNGVNIMRSLNAEVATVLEQPTPSPTPLISAVVLPSGHTPPQNGVTRFNEDEIPNHLRPLVQSLAAAMVLPTPSPQHAVNIKIPSINVFAPLVQGDGWEQLKKGVAQHLGTPNPGEKGNVVLSAHNDVFGEIFRDLDKLKVGDEVILYTQQKAYTYVVRQTLIVEPTQVEVMAPTREEVVTLISCYPYLIDNQRIVVVADLVQ